MKKLKDVSQLQTHVSHFSYESEMKKLKDEVAHHENMFMDASETITTLEDSLLNANNTVSNLLEDKIFMIWRWINKYRKIKY